MRSNVGKGAFVLVVSGIVCKFFGGLFRLPLTGIIGIEGIGIFQMIMSLYSLALVFISGGVTTALSRIVSSARARGDDKIIGSYLRYGLAFSLSIGAILAIFFFLFSSQIASLQGLSGGGTSYKLVALILPLGALIGVSRGILQGYSNMVPTAISQIVEQVSKFAFGLVFAYLLGRGGIGRGVFGAFLGILISEVLACLFLMFQLSRLGKFELSREGKREFFSASLPLTFGGAIMPFSHAIEGMTILGLLMRAGYTREIATSLFGLQTGIVGAILNFPLIISLAVAVSLLPNLTYVASQNDAEGQKRLITKSFLAMWYLLVPLVVGLMAVARELYPAIYPTAMKGLLPIALQLTYLSGVSIILTAIMQLLLSILQANGYYNYSLLFSVMGGIGKLAFLFIFAPIKAIGIYAIALSNIVLALIVIICSLVRLGSLIRVPFVDTFLPLLAAVVMFMAVKIFLSLIGGLVGLGLAVLLGGAIYFVLTLPQTVRYGEMILNKFSKREEEKS